MIALMIAAAVTAQPVSAQKVTCRLEAGYGHAMPVRICLTKREHEERQAYIQRLVREQQLRSFLVRR